MNKIDVVQDFVQAMLDGAPNRDDYAQWIDLLQQTSRITEFEHVNYEDYH